MATYERLFLAQKALTEFSELRIPKHKAKEVFIKLKEIAEEVDFVRTEINKITNQYAKKDERGGIIRRKDGSADFETAENELAWNKEIVDLYKSESQIKEQPISILDSDLADKFGAEQNIAPAWYALLRGFIEFEGIDYA